MLFIETLTFKKNFTVERHMNIIRGAFYSFVTTCEEEGCNSDDMFDTLLMVLEYRWDGQANKYFDGLRKAFEKAKEHKVRIA